MNIQQFRYEADNLSYLIYGENEAIAIDGGAVEGIMDVIGSAGLTLTAVTNTHAHRHSLIVQVVENGARPALLFPG